MEKYSPTLIIGLGGLGSEVVEKIYRKFDAVHPSELERANVVFLCLDTDKNDINDRLKVMPAESVVKTSSDLSLSVGQYVDRISTRTTVGKWFDTKSRELNSMSLGDGAAQVRMASRLAMISAISEGKLSPIDNAITQLMATDPARKQGNDIRIHVITSLAGGTGAGTFLQTAYYLQNAMRQHGAMAPKVMGYFVLPDTLIEGTGTFSDSQKENVRSNAYACLKELVEFSKSDRDKGLSNIEFEYRLGQRDKSLPASRPYDTCFIMDFNGASGGNLQMLRRYMEQMASFVFLNVFGKTGGDFRKRAINDVRQRIASDATNIYASFGVSKLVYPVDDLFAYFAHQRVADNMSTTWCQIDRDIDERMQEYNDNVFHGIPDTQPDRGKEFKRLVEHYKESAGNIGAQFKQIFNSTQELNEDMTPRRPKSRTYTDEVKAFVERTVEKSKELNGLYDDCTTPQNDFTKRDNGDKDIAFVIRRERELDDYKRAVMAYVDGSKQWLTRECFLADHDADDYVSKTPAAHRYHLNTFILAKDDEMHPLAVRYFLYDVKERLKTILEGKEGLTEANKQLKKKIEEDYKDIFDVLETKNKKETASDRLRAAKQNSGGLKGLGNILTGQNPYKAAKENYESLSKQQAADIHQYATDKLLEEVYAGLLDQINRLIEESENFFVNLPAALQSLDSKRVDLFTRHNVGNADKSVEYVLASEECKKDIYDKVISHTKSPFFPPKMSGSIYRTMFNNVFNQINVAGFDTYKKKDKKLRKAEAIAANKSIIEECIAFQEETLRESNRTYADKNVMAALKEEAMRESFNNEEKAFEYMKEKFHHFRERAEIWGPDFIDTEVRFINSWGYNEECTATGTIDAEKADTLFGDIAVDTNPDNAASRLVSEYFSKYEIVRCNTATLLSIDKHFSKLISKERTGNTDETSGSYFTAYNDVITAMHRPGSKTFTPHLDRYWHLPAYMPNIGSSMADEKKKLFRALYGGLLLAKFKAVYDGGTTYWKYQEKTWRFIIDANGTRVNIGNSQEDALNNLFIKGLVNNPDIVEQVNEYVDRQWEEAREKWLGTARDETNELQKMKESDIVDRIVKFRFAIHTSFKKEQNWFTLLNSRRGLTLYDVVSDHKEFFFEDLMDRLIHIFGASTNTMKLCKFVLGKTGTKLHDDAMALFQNYVDRGHFEPKDE